MSAALDELLDTRNAMTRALLGSNRRRRRFATVIRGAHVILYSSDAGADRAFLRDLLDGAAVDAGGGWLILQLPPAEVAVHPAETLRVPPSCTWSATTSTRPSPSGPRGASSSTGRCTTSAGAG